MKQLTRYRPHIACLLLVAFSACSNNTAPADAPANSTNPVVKSNTNAATPAPKSSLDGIVRASVEGVEMRAGETAEAGVKLSIAGGYHVNANPATEKFLIPTSLEVTPESGIKIEKTVYPKPLTKKFPFAEVPLAVYEGDVRIALALRAPRDAAPGQYSLGGRVRVQPCDDEKCYPPMTVETSIPVTIR